MLAALKAECVYVPIDTESPAARVAKVLDSCEPRWVLAHPSVLKVIDPAVAESQARGVLFGSVADKGFIGEHAQSSFSFGDLPAVADDHVVGNQLGLRWVVLGRIVENNRSLDLLGSLGLHWLGSPFRL